MLGLLRRPLSYLVPARISEAPRRRVERALATLPSAGLAEIVVDLASRGGADLSDVAERVFDRIGDLASQAGSEVGALAQTDAARQLRGFASKASERAAGLAYGTGAERLLDALPRRRRRSQSGLLLLGAAAAGLVAGAALVYLMTARKTEALRQQRPPQDPGEAPADRAEQAGPAAAPSRAGLSGLRQRLQDARSEARSEREQTEAELRREYAADLSNGSAR